MSIDFNLPVKFVNPLSENEAKMTFRVANYNPGTERVYIELICDLPIRPQELVSIMHIENV